MGKIREQRAEKRLCYRWHARFALNPKQKPLSGQMVDVSSKGMAILYHADKNCPKPNQFITTNFGVPYFDSEDSFDTVFFNRIGRVCRVDNLSSNVNRIAIQFAEPLFFKPGEQNISDSDIKKRLEAKAQSIVGGKEKTVTKSRTKVKSETTKSEDIETERSFSEALARAEERICSYAEAKARAEEKAKAETKTRTEAEKKAKTEARLRAKAEKKAKTEAEKRAKIEAELREKTKRKPKTQQKKAVEKKSTQDKTKQSGEGVLMEKIDKFITDRNKIF
jgi:hypothetical protein